MMFQPFGQYSDGILAAIVFALFWLLLRVQGTGLDALGLNQPARRWKEFCIGACVTGGALVLIQLAEAWFAGTSWQWNHSFVVADFLRFLVLPVVMKALVITLVFEGYLLLQLLRFAGPSAGLWTAAAAFGLYCCFSLQAFGNLWSTFTVFVLAGFYGFVLALAFRQTGSLAAPMGLNLGWHFVGKAVFAGPVPAFEMFHLPLNEPPKDAGFAGFAIYVGVLVAVLGLYSWLILRNGLTRGNAKHGFQAVRTEG